MENSCGPRIILLITVLTKIYKMYSEHLNSELLNSELSEIQNLWVWISEALMSLKTEPKVQKLNSE